MEDEITHAPEQLPQTATENEATVEDSPNHTLGRHIDGDYNNAPAHMLYPDVSLERMTGKLPPDTGKAFISVDRKWK